MHSRPWSTQGVALGLGLGLGCAVGTGSDGFEPAMTVGAGQGTDSASSGAEGNPPDGSGTGGGSATIGNPPDTDDPPPGSEICNGLDDDGDGDVDEDLPDQTCGVGSCEVTQPSCVGGVPQPCTPALPGVEVCNGLDDDCNGTVDDGAEQACSTACGDGVITCAGGVEQPCDAPTPQTESCNLEDDDCNGNFDEGVGGCRVGVHRSYNPATGEHFYTTDLGEAQCCGFTLEASDYYQLYVGPHPGLVPFYRCLTGGGLHFYTQSPTCEGTTVEGAMGYIAIAAGTAGSTPLYRVYLGANGDHFYTTSMPERDSAIASGYVDEGIAGYVW